VPHGQCEGGLVRFWSRAASAAASVYPGPMRQGLIIAGLVLLALGLAWPWLGRIGLGRLPGKPGFAFYFPLGSSVLVSIMLSPVLSPIIWLFCC
jgi:hypothetical protein